MRPFTLALVRSIAATLAGCSWGEETTDPDAGPDAGGMIDANELRRVRRRARGAMQRCASGTCMDAGKVIVGGR